MINLDDEVILNFDESCTKQEAVAKMLGWMRGHRRLKYVELNKFRTGVEAKYLPYINQLMFPVDEQLAALREVAWHELMDVGEAMVAAKESGDDIAYSNLELKCSEKFDALEQCDRDIESAVDYLHAINQEISKGAEFVDESATKKYGELHINIASFDLWARTRFGKTISDVEPGFSEGVISNANKNPEEAGKKLKRYDALRPELESILEAMDEPTPSKVMAELRKIAGTPNSCIIAISGDGVKWEHNNGNVAVLNINALAERMKTWKKYRLSQG